MSDMTQAVSAAGLPGWVAALDRRTARFVSDHRFGGAPAEEGVDNPRPEGDALQPPQDIWQEGYAAGFAAAAADAEARNTQDEEARAGLQLAFARLDEAAQRELADRLVDIVVRLCEETLEPLALDHAALQRRCEAAATMLGEAPDRLTLSLSPADLPMLDPATRNGLTVIADDRLPRGMVRLEGIDGGVTDGPATWSARIREALAQC